MCIVSPFSPTQVNHNQTHLNKSTTPGVLWFTKIDSDTEWITRKRICPFCKEPLTTIQKGEHNSRKTWRVNGQTISLLDSKLTRQFFLPVEPFSDDSRRVSWSCDVPWCSTKLLLKPFESKGKTSAPARQDFSAVRSTFPSSSSAV